MADSKEFNFREVESIERSCRCCTFVDLLPHHNTVGGCRAHKKLVDVVGTCDGFTKLVPLVRECRNCVYFTTLNKHRIDSKGICRYCPCTPTKDPTDYCYQFCRGKEIEDDSDTTE